MANRLSRGSFISLSAAAVLAPHPAAAAIVTIKAGSARDDDATPYLYAIQSGIFKKNGIEAVLTGMNSGSAVSTAVAGGSFDIGKSSLMGLIAAHARKIPFLLIAPAGEYFSTASVGGMLVKTDGPIKKAADLNGKVIAVSALNDLYTITTRAWIDSHGGDSTTVKFIELPISAVPAAIEQGRIDAGNVLEPELEVAIESKTVRVLSHPFDAIAPNFTFSGWFTTKEFAEKNRDTVDRFVRSIREAANYTNAHHDLTVDALAQYTKVDSAVIKKSTRATAGLDIELKKIQPLIDTAAKYKVIPETFDARDLVNPTVLRL